MAFKSLFGTSTGRPWPLCVRLAAGLASHSLQREASGSMDTPPWTETLNCRGPAAKRTPNDAEAATTKPLTGKDPQGWHGPAPLFRREETKDGMGGRRDLLKVRRAVVSSLPKRRPPAFPSWAPPGARWLGPQQCQLTPFPFQGSRTTFEAPGRVSLIR